MHAFIAVIYLHQGLVVNEQCGSTRNSLRPLKSVVYISVFRGMCVIDLSMVLWYLIHLQIIFPVKIPKCFSSWFFFIFQGICARQLKIALSCWAYLYVFQLSMYNLFRVWTPMDSRKEVGEKLSICHWFVFIQFRICKNQFQESGIEPLDRSFFKVGQYLVIGVNRHQWFLPNEI